MSLTTTVPVATNARAPVQWAKSVAQRPPPSKYQTIDGMIKSHVAEGLDSTLVAYPATGVNDFEEYTAQDLDRFTDAAVAKYISHGINPADAEQPEAPVVALLAPSSLEVVVTIFALSRMGYAVLFLSTRLAADAYARLMELSNCSRIIPAPNLEKMAAEINNIRACQIHPLVAREDYRHVQNTYSIQRRGVDPAKEANKIAWIIHSSGSTGFPKPIFLTNFQCLANFYKKPGMRAFCVSPLFHSHALMEFGGAIYTKQPMFLGNYALPVTTSNLIKAMSVAKPDLFNVVPYVLKLMAEQAEGIAQLREAKLVLYAGSACPDALGDKLVAAGVNLVANYGCTETGFIMSSVRPPGDTEWNYVRLHQPIAKHVLMDEISPGVFECVGLDGLPSKGPSNSNNPPNSFRTKDLFTRHADPAKSNFYKYLSRSDDRLTLVNGEKVLPLPIEGRIRQDPLVEQAAVFGAGRSVPGVIIFRSELSADMSDADLLAGIRPSIDAANSAAETFSRIPEELIIAMPAGTVYPKTDKFTFIRAQLYQVFASAIEAAYTAFEDTLPAEATELKTLSVGELESFLMDAFATRLSTPLDSTTSDIFSAGVDSLQTTRLYSIIRKELDLGANGPKLSSNVVFEKGTVAALAQHLHRLRTGEGDEASTDDTDLMRSLVEEFSTFTPTQSAAPRRANPPAKPTIILTGATGSLGAYILSTLLSHPSTPHIYALVRAPDDAAATKRVLTQLSSRNITLTPTQLANLTCLASDLTHPTLSLSAAHLTTLHATLTHTIHCAWPVNFTLPLPTFRPALQGLRNLLQLSLTAAAAEATTTTTTGGNPVKFFFCSSVSVASNTPNPTAPPAPLHSQGRNEAQGQGQSRVVRETLIPDLTHAQATGYGKSKLVAEMVVHRANAAFATATAVHNQNQNQNQSQKRQGRQFEATTLRVGQLSGDLRGPARWNATEGVSLLVRCALPASMGGVGCLPRLDERVSWLPVDVCGEAVGEVVLRGCWNASRGGSAQVPNDDDDDDEQPQPPLTYHVLNPHTLHWSHDFLPALKRTGLVPFADFEIVSPQEWLRRLRASDPDPARNPSVKLLRFWEGKYGAAEPAPSGADPEVVVGANAAAADGNGNGNGKGIQFETHRTLRHAPAVGSATQEVLLAEGKDGYVGKLVRSWMSVWTASGSAEKTA